MSSKLSKTNIFYAYIITLPKIWVRLLCFENPLLYDFTIVILNEPLDFLVTMHTLTDFQFIASRFRET